MPRIDTFFAFDTLAIIMLALIALVGGVVLAFSRRYMAGDRRYGVYFLTLASLIISAMVMVTADHLALFFGAWCTSNLLLARLMVHKPEWRAAKASGFLALRTFAIGVGCIGAAFLLIAQETGSSSIHTIIATTASLTPTLYAALGLLLIGAMTQSGIYPFHRWLISSLNAPTPVSALMHAGLVNGGGFLLVRFAPLLLAQPLLLNVLFAAGLLTALLGTSYKLLQHDIKRMLACSTMGQMGFMLLQCGLGLFPAAVAHLCWHGLFKAYQFLAVGSTISNRSASIAVVWSIPTMVVALAGALLGSYAFSLTSGKIFTAADTSRFLIGIAMIASAQLMLLHIASGLRITRIAAAFSLTAIAGGAYGISVRAIEHWLEPLGLAQPQPLNALHYLGFAALSTVWLLVNWRPAFLGRGGLQRIGDCLYVRMLNASQPATATLTTARGEYAY